MPRTGQRTNARRGNAADALAVVFIGGVQNAIPHSGWG
jgi:hypothetical protein